MTRGYIFFSLDSRRLFFSVQVRSDASLRYSQFGWSVIIQTQILFPVNDIVTLKQTENSVKPAPIRSRQPGDKEASDIQIHKSPTAELLDYN